MSMQELGTSKFKNFMAQHASTIAAIVMIVAILTYCVVFR